MARYVKIGGSTFTNEHVCPKPQSGSGNVVNQNDLNNLTSPIKKNASMFIG